MTHPDVQAPTFLVLDDHAAVLAGTFTVLQTRYPSSQITTTSTVAEAQALISSAVPDLLVMDLSIPAKAGDSSQIQNGLGFLKTLLADYPNLNIVVQSAHVQTLVRLKPSINAHKGGLTIADKSLTSDEMLTKVDWALQGLLYTPPEMRTGLEVKPEWLQVIELAFNHSLTDKAIAQEMHVAERTVRYYWTRVQDALQVYPNNSINIRVQTYVRAREVGLLD
ncbi:response regulator transcription factor [Leptothoe sp. PORK10 BA2]|uniref:response regulator transcription factor n=1 Tax=Leptothoe sp. PORK10 BA2 TaxID=3110254 RepID=UPI002B1FCBD7|nr:response regulator transcription factor [Leptothoe sp. PORK10 BA2]MEA5463532.1 response regulator transcription factor [Leptothoe sp. PORK10 BA2]